MLNRPAGCLCNGVMCLPWPGDFLLPEALKVITVEEDLSSAAMCVWSSPQHFAPLTLPKITARAATAARAHTEKSILSFFFPLFTKDIFSLISGYNHHDDSCINCLTPCSSTSHNPDTSTVEVTWLWIECGVEGATDYRSIDSQLIPLKWLCVGSGSSLFSKTTGSQAGSTLGSLVPWN